MTVSWHSFDLVSGRRGPRLEATALGTVKRMIGQPCDVTIPVRMFDHVKGKPVPGWLEGTDPGLTMLVALDGDDEQIVWGGMVVRETATEGPTTQISVVTLEHYFTRRYVGNISWTTDTDLATIANNIVDSIATGGIGLVVATIPTGVVLQGEYASSEDVRVGAVLDTLAGMDGGIEYTVDLTWANADHTALTKTLHIRPRLGLAPVTPTTWALPGCINGFTYTRDFTSEYGANDVMAVSSGEGADRPFARRSDEALITGGWPRYERRFTPGTSITSTTTLESHAAAELAQTREGLTQLDIIANLRTAPRFGVDWFLGDDIDIALSCDRFPAVMGPDGYVLPGFTQRMRAVGVELDFDAKTVKPITQEADA